MIEKKKVTGEAVFKYLREQLNMGISLSNCVNKLSIENGEVYSFVPSDTPIERLYNFKIGGIYPFNKEELEVTQLIPIRNDARPIVLREIREYIEANTENCCIFENPNASPYFPWVKTSGIDYVHLRNEEMYFFFDKKNSDLKKLENAFNISEVYIFLCVLSSLNKKEHFRFEPFKEITVDLLELFLSKTSKIFIKAYDGEGYLMWSKS